MAKICGIYKITNPKKKVYIGQSSSIKSRFSFYKRVKCKDQSRLYNSLKKYGVEKHKFDVIHQCEPERLNELECYYIELFQCFNNQHGLNLQSGGHNGLHSEESKRKISESKKGENNCNYGKTGENHPRYGKKLSEEHKKKLLEANLGKKRSEETKRKISEAGKGRIASKETKQKMSESAKNRYFIKQLN